MKKIPVIDFHAPSTYSSISRKELKEIQRKAIKIWYFEKVPGGKGYMPVAGEYDPINPNHLNPKKVIRQS